MTSPFEEPNDSVTCGTIMLGSHPPTATTESELPPCQWVLRRQGITGAIEQQVAITLPMFTIGRHESCHLSINDATVSGRHAELILIDDDLFVRDLGSTNGTLLHGRPMNSLTGLRHGDILHFGSVMCTVRRPVEESVATTLSADVSADVLGQLQFEKLLQRPALRPFFQPVVRLADEQIVGFEILSRSALIGLETPEKMFRIAAQRMSETALSRMCRSEGLRVGEILGHHFQFFLNTHPSEIGTTDLFESLVSLRSESPDVRVVVEIHEAAAASPQFLRQLREVTRGLNMQIAYDDFGTGQARVSDLFDIPPDILKFDLNFVKCLSSARSNHRNSVQSLLRIVHDLGVIPVAEGIETDEEAEICLDLGFTHAQGYLFGRAETAGYWSRVLNGNDGADGYR